MAARRTGLTDATKDMRELSGAGPIAPAFFVCRSMSLPSRTGAARPSRRATMPHSLERGPPARGFAVLVAGTPYGRFSGWDFEAGARLLNAAIAAGPPTRIAC